MLLLRRIDFVDAMDRNDALEIKINRKRSFKKILKTKFMLNQSITSARHVGFELHGKY